jgi:hypothetical protein
MCVNPERIADSAQRTAPRRCVAEIGRKSKMKIRIRKRSRSKIKRKSRMSQPLAQTES